MRHIFLVLASTAVVALAGCASDTDEAVPDHDSTEVHDETPPEAAEAAAEGQVQEETVFVEKQAVDGAAAIDAAAEPAPAAAPSDPLAAAAPTLDTPVDAASTATSPEAVEQNPAAVETAAVAVETAPAETSAPPAAVPAEPVKVAVAKPARRTKQDRSAKAPKSQPVFAAATVAGGFVWYVSADGTPLREQPNAEARKLESLRKGDPVLAVASGEWAQVSGRGYVAVKDLSQQLVPRSRVASLWEKPSH